MTESSYNIVNEKGVNRHRQWVNPSLSFTGWLRYTFLFLHAWIIFLVTLHTSSAPMNTLPTVLALTWLPMLLMQELRQHTLTEKKHDVLWTAGLGWKKWADIWTHFKYDAAKRKSECGVLSVKNPCGSTKSLSQTWRDTSRCTTQK